jgi:gliding motility-associated-like protein
MLQNYKIVKYSILFSLFLFTNANGQTIHWQNTIGGDNYEWADFIELTNDGNYISGGYSDSDISRDKTENSRGLNDFWLIKIDDSSGNLLWQKTIGGIDRDHLISAKETTDGGYILGGYSASGISGEKTQNSRGYDDYWVVKLDANRNIVWDKTYGGNGFDRLTSIIQTDDGGYLMGGSSDSNMSGEKSENSRGDIDMWLIKIDASGNIIWQKTFGGSKMDWVESMIKTPDGGYILAGSSHSDISGEKNQNSRGIGDYWILKIDASGTMVWQKTIGGNNGDYAKSIVASSDGNYIIGGDSSSTISGEKNQNTINGSDDVWLIKLDDNGQLLWQKNIGGNSTESFENMRITSDDGLILGIMSYSDISGAKTEVSRGDRDYWMVKLDSNGNFEWDKTIGGDSNDQIQSIVQAKDGGFVMAGWSQSNISGDKTENKSGLQDIWIVKLNVCSKNISASSNSPVCLGDTIELSAIGGTGYAWTGPNGFTSIEQNPLIHNANTATGGQYSCSITGTGGCNDTKLVNVIINSQPLPTVISPQIFCIQENATLNNISISGQNIKWYDSNDGILANSTALQNGLFYYASQTIDGCESERIPVLINIPDVTSSDCATSSEEFSYPKFFTPNGDGHNDTWNIQFSDLEKNTIVKIFDRYGKLLKELGYNSNGWDGSYTGQELPATDYWFVVTRENGKEYRGHFSLKR